MTYNLTAIENVNSFYALTKEVNTLSSDLLGLAIVSVIFLISFFYMKKYDTETTFIASSFITSLIAGMMFFTDLISFSALIVPFLCLCVGIFMKLFTD